MYFFRINVGENIWELWNCLLNRSLTAKSIKAWLFHRESHGNCRFFLACSSDIAPFSQTFALNLSPVIQIQLLLKSIICHWIGQYHVPHICTHLIWWRRSSVIYFTALATWCFKFCILMLQEKGFLRFQICYQATSVEGSHQIPFTW